MISGTRTPVRSIVAYHALSFYYDRQAEIDADLDANREEYVRRLVTGEDPPPPLAVTFNKSRKA